MRQKICSNTITDRVPDDAPYADELRRYLRHCAEHGAAAGSLRIKRNELLWLAAHLGPNARNGVDLSVLSGIAWDRHALHGATTAVRRVIDIGRPWLRFLGWWREPAIAFKHQDVLDEYVAWMRWERGFTPATIEGWTRTIRQFLRWYEQKDRALAEIEADDIDEYFVAEGTGRWSRVWMASLSAALRVFLRFAAARGLCADRLAESVGRPRLYQQESLPYAPSWSDVRRILADADTDKPRDIRDRAILMLLAIYGMRSGEVAALRIDQVDWSGRTLRLIRLKRRQPQVYPLVPSVAEALARYIDLIRPPSPLPEIFLCMHAPRRRMKAGSMYNVANRRFVALGIEAAHRGGHALRHACAMRLLAEGLSFKEIGDHLGHRSSSATAVYAKVNMNALRKVAAFDLGDLP